MTQDVPVPFDSEFQSPIPMIWREKIIKIVEAFKDKDFSRLNIIPNVVFIDTEYAASIAENIDDYGARLISLPKESWDSSVCLYIEKNRWDAIVDLFTEDEGRSDLIIHFRIYMHEDQYWYEIMDIYVP